MNDHYIPGTKLIGSASPLQESYTILMKAPDKDSDGTQFYFVEVQRYDHIKYYAVYEQSFLNVWMKPIATPAQATHFPVPERAPYISGDRLVNPQSGEVYTVLMASPSADSKGEVYYFLKIQEGPLLLHVAYTDAFLQEFTRKVPASFVAKKG